MESQQVGENIGFDYFSKLDIRIATIVKAEKAENTDKLLRLEVDLGTEKRQLIAGIAQFYSPEEILGKQIPILANLEPKKFKGLESQGMILAIDVEGDCVLLHPNKKVPNGAKVR